MDAVMTPTQLLGIEIEAYRRGFWRGLMIGLVAGIGISMMMSSARADRMGGPGFSVYDGDTFSIGKERFRLAGVDAPEIGWRARCPLELELAIRAREEVRGFMAQPYDLVPAPGRDRYRRTLITVRSWSGT